MQSICSSSFLLSCFTGLSIAAYSLTDDYSGNLVNQFTFFTDADPTNGYVDYVDSGSAQSLGLVKQQGGGTYLGVDTQSTSGKRKAVRLSSNTAYDDGLFVVDVGHMPVGCGAWPAFWLLGPDWPNNGEIDIIEGVSLGSLNKNSLHTKSGCTISGGGSMKGTLGNTQCESGAGGNEGCGVDYTDPSSYGPGLNSAGGAVYATEVTAENIKIWFWPSGSAPSDATGSNPDPSGWGEPSALFSGCDIKSFFKSMQIIINTTFCGDWAGQAWSSDGQCSDKASTCESYVETNPSAFTDAYWTIKGLKVYSGSASGSENTVAGNDGGKVNGGQNNGGQNNGGQNNGGQNNGGQNNGGQNNGGENNGGQNNGGQTNGGAINGGTQNNSGQNGRGWNNGGQNKIVNNGQLAPTATTTAATTTSVDGQNQWGGRRQRQTGTPQWGGGDNQWGGGGGRGGWGGGGGWRREKREIVNEERSRQRQRRARRHLVSGHARGRMDAAHA